MDQPEPNLKSQARALATQLEHRAEQLALLYGQHGDAVDADYRNALAAVVAKTSVIAISARDIADNKNAVNANELVFANTVLREGAATLEQIAEALGETA